jgi:hypothetical protein
VLAIVYSYNWGSTVAFWRDLGYALEFTTDHHSGRLRHPSGGPAIFIAERPLDHALQVVLGVAVTNAARFTPPGSGTVVRPKTTLGRLADAARRPGRTAARRGSAAAVNKEASNREIGAKK